MEGAADEALMLLVTESDGWALSQLYDRYSGLVYSAGMRYLGDRTLAEDLVQDVFFSVWRDAASFDSSKASFSTWVSHITRNRAIDLARRRRARVQTVTPNTEGVTLPELGEDDGTEEILKHFDVVGALSRISPAYREVLALAYLRGLSQREISRRTGIPLGTVKSRTTAALRAVRELMLAAETTKGTRKDTSKGRWSQDG